MEISESISILQSPEKIWNFWMPVTTDVQWRNGITKAELTSKPPYGVGSTGIHYHKDLGPMPWTIIKWEDGSHMEWVIGECKFADSIGSYHVEPENGGCRVTIHSKMVLPFFMRIIMAILGRKVVKADLLRLKSIMEKMDNQSSEEV